MKKSFYTASEMTPARMEAIISCLPHAFGYNVTCDKNKVIFEPAGPSRKEVETECNRIITNWGWKVAIDFSKRTHCPIGAQHSYRIITCTVVKNNRCYVGTAIFKDEDRKKDPTFSDSIGQLIALYRALNIKKLPDIVEKYLEDV